jgi:hypothetical protein
VTPQQILQALSRQKPYRQLSATLDPLFRLIGKESVTPGLRREAAKIRRELCRKIAKAMRKMQTLEQPSMTVVGSAEVVTPKVGERFLYLSIRFVFFVSVGAVCMFDPVVTIRFV